jgi:hypothetical protein
MSNCAVIDVTTTVINIIVAEPTDTPPENTYLVLVPPDLPVMIGYTYVDPYFYDFDGNVVVPYVEVADGG